MPLLEDCDLYLRLQARGICGIRCPYPLLYYTNSGKRSKRFKEDAAFVALYERIYNQYRESAKQMCKCTEKVVMNGIPEGQPGDILVQALYEPQARWGPVTGRLYERPRGTNNYRLYVAPEDLAARPNWWQVVAPTVEKTLGPSVDEVRRMAAEALKTNAT